jgi:hypothetical protein
MSNTNYTPPISYRQGDVFLTLVDAVPADAKPVKARGARGLVLQEGEVTGHAHRIPSRRASLMRTEEDARYMRGTAPVALRHEEHKTMCEICPRIPGVVATHVQGEGHELSYFCDAHRVPRARKLGEPGELVIPAGNYLVTIHAEYSPGELPRQVAD